MITQIIHFALWPIFFVVCWFVINYVLRKFEKKHAKDLDKLN